MYNLERQTEILHYLEQHGSASVEKLSALLYVSAPTVRRDLSALEQAGKVRRTHGGVLLRQAAEREIPLLYRESQNHLSKQRIAQKAAKLVHDGDVLFLDASSTVAHLVPYLRDFHDLIVVTNSPKTSLELGEANIKNYCTGGLLLAHSIAYVGTAVEDFIQNINANVFFFSSRGYEEGGTITDSSMEEAAAKRAMLRNAKQVFYLCDLSKRGQQYMYNICPVSAVDGILTEED